MRIMYLWNKNESQHHGRSSENSQSINASINIHIVSVYESHDDYSGDQNKGGVEDCRHLL